MKRRSFIKLLASATIGIALGSFNFIQSVYAKSLEITRIPVGSMRIGGKLYQEIYLQVRIDSPERYYPKWHIVLELIVPDPTRPGREITLVKKHIDLEGPKDFWEALRRYKFVVNYITINPQVFCDNVFNKNKVAGVLCSLHDPEYGSCIGVWCRIPELTNY